MTKKQFISINSIVPDILDTTDEGLFSIADAVEFASKAMGQLDIYETFEEAVSIVKVENHQAFLPCGLLQVNQILYKLDFNMTENDKCECKAANQVYKDFSSKYFLTCDYVNKNWAPLRASTNSFLVSVLCPNSPNLHTSCQHEFTILPTGKIVTSFKEGWIIISYLRAPMDEEGNFLIPDDEELIQALRTYIMYRLWEKRWNMKEEGSRERFEYYRNQWGMYKGLIRGKFKLPSADQWQNIIEYSNTLIPKRNRYYKYFGTLGTPDKTFF